MQISVVLFSDFTQRHANEYGLTGWVRNTADGKVYIHDAYFFTSPNLTVLHRPKRR